MGCNQSVKNHDDSDTDSSSSSDVAPFNTGEHLPIYKQNNINSVSSSTTKPKLNHSNLNNMNNDLHKIHVTQNGTLSPKSKDSKSKSSKYSKFPNNVVPSSTSNTHSSPSLHNNNHNDFNILTKSTPNLYHPISKYPQNPVPSDKIPNATKTNYRLRALTAESTNDTKIEQEPQSLQHKQNLQKYRTKKVTIYKPKLKVPDFDNNKLQTGSLSDDPESPYYTNTEENDSDNDEEEQLMAKTKTPIIATMEGLI